MYLLSTGIKECSLAALTETFDTIENLSQKSK